MASLVTKIDHAGKYPVQQIPCPHFSQPVLVNGAPRAGVLHTTEGSWESSIEEFHEKYAPHFLIGLDKNKKPGIAQLVPIGFIGAALVTHNNLAIVQIEMVGFSQEKPWLPDPATLDLLASLMLACRDAWGIELSHPWPDKDWPKYGKNPHRTSGKFGKIGGWYGHGDIPDNLHWDPGAILWTKVFEHAHAIDKPTTGSA